MDSQIKIETTQEEKDKENTMESLETSATPPIPTGLVRQTSSGGKINCLCSPTTHAGSFRCRLHRAPSGLQRTRSVDPANTLAELHPKDVTDTLETTS